MLNEGWKRRSPQQPRRCRKHVEAPSSSVLPPPHRYWLELLLRGTPLPPAGTIGTTSLRQHGGGRSACNPICPPDATRNIRSRPNRDVGFAELLAGVSAT